MSEPVTTPKKARAKTSQPGRLHRTSRLDAALILIALADVSAAMLILAFHPIPDKQLPIFVGVVTGPIAMVFGAYVAARWQNRGLDGPVK